VPDSLVGDNLRLRQVVVNLVGNAIKFTQRGEVLLQVNLESESEREIVLHFTVSDTGIGIPKDRQEAIFGAFEQMDGSTTRKYGGTGLGLSICTELVRLMGGRIWLESEVGRGSVFHFTTVLALGNGISGSKPTQLSGLRALVVDDNSTNRAMLQEMLTNWQVRTNSASTLDAALTAVEAACREQDPYSVVLLDSSMPGSDPVAAAETIRRNPATAATKLLLLMAGAEMGDVARCRQMGIDAVVLKPVRQSSLFNSILSAINGAIAAAPEAETAEERKCELRILLAEDNPVNQKLAQRILEKRGHKVVVANNGREALRFHENQYFDVILMDLQMPELDGMETTAQIRLREKSSGLHIPIVAMTAHAMKGDRERCLEAGMDEYVSKPIQVDQLLQVLSKVVARPESEGVAVEKALPVDIDFALSRMEGDAQLLREIAHLFSEEAVKLMSIMRSAVDRGDSEALTGAAHTMKGMVGNFGAKASVEAAFRLEQLGRAGDMVKAVSAYAELQAEIERVIPFVERLTMEEAA
jgi:CheY-like chemotaxis protein/HPt (histidine-containing phosphotransfer) domain-containing protein